MVPTWPSGFTIQGKCSASGVAFQSANQCGEPHIRLSDDGSVYEMMFVASRTVPGGNTPAQISYTDVPVRNNLVTGWRNTREGGNGATIMQMSIIAGSPNTEALDTPAKILSPQLNRYICYFQSRPGNRPVNSGTGHISIIQAGTSPILPGHLCRWCQKPNTKLLEPSQAWHAGFIRTSPGPAVWAGGVLECAPIWKTDTNEMLMFFAGWGGTTNGPHTSQLGRATDKTGGGLGKFNLEPTTPVFNRRVGTGGVWGNSDIGMESSVTLDPDGHTLWCLFIGAQIGVENSYGIGIARSDDWGLTWTMSGSTNPLLTIESPGFPVEVPPMKTGAPTMIASYDLTQWILVFGAKRDPGPAGSNDGIYIATATRVP